MKVRVPSAALEGLLYALIVFGPFAFGAVEPWSVAALELLAFLLALGCFLRGRGAASAEGAAAWLLPASVAALGWAQGMNAAAADAPRPLGPFTADPHATQAAVLLWAAYAAVLYAVPRIVATPGTARRFVRVLFGLGLATAALGLAQDATSVDLIYWFRPTLHDVPPFAAFYNRDHAANLILMCLAAGGGLLFSLVGRGRSVDGPLPGERRTRGLTLAGLLLLFAAVVATHSRGALLALPLAAAALGAAGAGFAPSRARRWLWLSAALGGAALIVFFAFAHVLSGDAAGAPMDRSVSSRLLIYADCWNWWRDSPMFGTGLGSFDSVYRSYQDQSLRAVVSHAHSDWLEFLLETGLAGAGLVLAGAALALGAAVRTWWRAKSSEMRGLIGGALAALAAFAAHSLFEFNFQIPADAVVFFALAGFALSAPAWCDKAPRAPRSEPHDPELRAASVAAWALLSAAAVLPVVAAWSADSADIPAVRVGRLARAVEWDGDPFYKVELARALGELASARPNGDPALQRSALAYELAALGERPFDAGTLNSAGDGLWRLGRGSDAREMFQAQRRVAFSPLPAARGRGVP